jgi:RimJ/RimL family protein N-acetyltransferase
MNRLMNKRPEVLEGNRVKLIPLEAWHSKELWETAKDETLWEHYTFRKMETFEKFKEFIDYSIDMMVSGSEFTFTITDNRIGRMVGGTSFLDILPESRSLEIGRTWIAKYLQRTGFNEECKLHLLKYCFEEMKAIRVFFKTDSNNKRSQKALEKIGAKYEGILRNHMIRDDGTYRHSAYYSIIESEWESVKKLLSSKIT